ncbi:MAG: Hsp20/alpha crystallin family protein [Acholeplasmatales bacterium]|nr:Hsp20/alpha crystallin family protein [Acholeplasmatales bacterium]
MLSLYRKNRSFFDDFFNDFRMVTPNTGNTLMKTDITETENSYRLAVELPGYDKDDIKVSIEDGYLLIEAEKKIENDEKDNNDKFLRRERYYGSMKRSYYVGDVEIDAIKGSFDKGILHLEIPRETKKIPEKKYLELK